MHHPRHRPAQARVRAPGTDESTGRQRLRALTTLLLMVATIIYLNGCGGGGDGTGGNGLQSPNNPQQSTDLATAQKLYDGTPRTPAGFYAEPAPPGVTGTVATTHLKNSDLAGAASDAVAFELCSDDMAQAIAWSEGRSSFMGSYADLVDTTGNARYWELTRVPRSDVTARLRHRVFKCTYVDRSLTNPTNDSGPAGTLNLRPLEAAALQELSEYLWRFTLYNNADHVVLVSAPVSASGGLLAHAIDMARLVRAASTSDCDRIDLLRWTHTGNAASGALSRTLELQRSFRARRPNGIVELCTP